MTGVAPQLPDSGWRILYQEALNAFLADERNLEVAGQVGEWIVACRRLGPPGDAIDCGDDVYLAPVPGSRVVAEYLIIESEYLIICKEFR